MTYIKRKVWNGTRDIVTWRITRTKALTGEACCSQSHKTFFPLFILLGRNTTPRAPPWANQPGNRLTITGKRSRRSGRDRPKSADFAPLLDATWRRFSGPFVTSEARRAGWMNWAPGTTSFRSPFPTWARTAGREAGRRGRADARRVLQDAPYAIHYYTMQEYAVYTRARYSSRPRLEGGREKKRRKSFMEPRASASGGGPLAARSHTRTTWIRPFSSFFFLLYLSLPSFRFCPSSKLSFAPREKRYCAFFSSGREVARVASRFLICYDHFRNDRSRFIFMSIFPKYHIRKAIDIPIGTRIRQLTTSAFSRQRRNSLIAKKRSEIFHTRISRTISVFGLVFYVTFDVYVSIGESIGKKVRGYDIETRVPIRRKHTWRL